MSGKAAPKVASSSSFALHPESGTPVAATPPLEVPKGTKFSEPETLVKAAPGSIPKGKGEKFVVTYAIDGDTVQGTRADGSPLTCRIDSIDAPERAKPKYGKAGQAYGEESKQTLENLIQNKEVNLRVTQATDRYGRALCQIEIEGKGIDQSMVESGAAMVYKYFAEDPLRRSFLDEVQAKAKKEKKGLWANPDTINPIDFKHPN